MGGLVEAAITRSDYPRPFVAKHHAGRSTMTGGPTTSGWRSMARRWQQRTSPLRRRTGEWDPVGVVPVPAHPAAGAAAGLGGRIWGQGPT